LLLAKCLSLLLRMPQSRLINQQEMQELRESGFLQQKMEPTDGRVDGLLLFSLSPFSP
jgi:hypothetical protein